MALVVGASGQRFGGNGHLHVLAHQRPKGIEHALTGAQAEGLQAVLKEPVEVASQFGEGAVVDHGAGLHIR
ncbi:hypothetical protein D9M68_975610 [compost metagenome]